MITLDVCQNRVGRLFESFAGLDGGGGKDGLTTPSRNCDPKSRRSWPVLAFLPLAAWYDRSFFLVWGPCFWKLSSNYNIVCIITLSSDEFPDSRCERAQTPQSRVYWRASPRTKSRPLRPRLLIVSPHIPEDAVLDLSWSAPSVVTMVDLLPGNQSSVVSAPVAHRIYSDDGLSWPNRKADFVGFLVPFLVCAHRLLGMIWGCH